MTPIVRKLLRLQQLIIPSINRFMIVVGESSRRLLGVCCHHLALLQDGHGGCLVGGIGIVERI